ncbi:unnamed protein product, partial [Closterium sp. NIES-53]
MMLTWMLMMLADDVILEGGLRIPGSVYNKLFEYQRTGVKWLWELHCQEVGGILGDEMGLGKTVQVAAFLASLLRSGLYRPSLLVCPVTLLRQWQREVRIWCPELNPVILHDSGGGACIVPPILASMDKWRKALESAVGVTLPKKPLLESHPDSPLTALALVPIPAASGSARGNSLVITTYEQVRLRRELFLAVDWGYAILDEGHRIRNPDADTTIACKQLRTPHRLLLSGSPIQNRLDELWSLMDFVYPGRLGTLPVFSTEFALPIAIGGYLNATPLQVATAYKCAVVLRDVILPYLLRRVKADVDIQLPEKTERVLLVPITRFQRTLYRAFLQ